MKRSSPAARLTPSSERTRDQGCDQTSPQRVVLLPPCPLSLSPTVSLCLSDPSTSSLQFLKSQQNQAGHPLTEQPAPFQVITQTRLPGKQCDSQHRAEPNCGHIKAYLTPSPSFQGHESEVSTLTATPQPPDLVALVSLVGGAAGGVGEDVGLGVLVCPELLLAGLQQLGGLHHVLHILVLIEPLSQEAGEVAVLVPAGTRGVQGIKK